MGYFDLPTGEFDLLLKDGKGEQWKNVMFTDSINASEIAECVEEWSVYHKVLKARFNGREVAMPTHYHWELRHKEEAFGSFKTRKEAVEAMYQRKAMWRKDKTIKVGLPCFVTD